VQIIKVFLLLNRYLIKQPGIVGVSQDIYFSIYSITVDIVSIMCL